MHSGGAFPGPVFPSSRWNFQKATDPRHWTPPVPRPPQPREPQRSRRGSRKLLDFPVAAAFARNRNPRPAPPTRPSGTRCGGWGLGMRAPPKWGAGRPGSGGEGSFSGDPTPGGLVRPAALHHPLLPRESRTPNPSRAGCGGWQSPPARERNAAAPAARGWAPFLCAYCGFPTRWRREGQGHLQRAVQPECGELPLAWEGEGGNGHREV